MRDPKIIWVGESKWEKFKRKRKEDFDSIVSWVEDHKGFCMMVAPVGLSLVTVTVKLAANVISAKVRTEGEKEVKELYVYDRSLGHYWKLRRKLTNAEWTEIDSRKANGERLGDILDSMKVLA